MKNFFLALCLVFSFAGISQEFELGKVSQKELSETVHPIDASATAAILFKTGTTSFDFDNRGNWIVVTDVSVRVKIYKKEGYSFASVEVPYYDGGLAGGEEVVFYDAATYNLENGKRIQTKLKDEGKFVDEPVKKWKVKKITLPNVREGSVLEYRYVIKSPYITSLPDWHFQYAIPVNYIQYGVYIPHYFVYNRILSPYIAIDEKVETKKATRIFSNPNPKGAYNKSSTTAQAETGSVGFYEIRKTYTAANVPALNDEGYVDNIKNYQSFVKHELASTDFPDAPKKDYATTWDAVARFIYNEEGFGEELQRKLYYEKDVDAILAKTTVRSEVIAAIFDIVKNKMAWNGEYGYCAKQKLNDAYQQRTGNGAEINLMLIAMLRYAGLNANPVLLSTRNNGHVAFVNRNEFNYVIAGVESQNGITFLDATSKNALPGILPIRALNGTGRIIRENLSSEELNLMPQVNSKENTTVVTTVGPDGVVTGHVKKYYFDYEAYLYRENFNDVNKEIYTEKLESKLGLSQVKDYNVVNDDYTKPIVEDFSFESNNLVEVIGGKMYISPMLFYTMRQNPFKQEKRSYPVDFTFPQQDKYTFNINLPSGYAVDSLPESAYYQIKDNVGGFRFTISATKPDQVQVVVVNDINYAMVNADYYPAIKEFFGNVVKKQGEKIVLKKL